VASLLYRKDQDQLVPLTNSPHHQQHGAALVSGAKTDRSGLPANRKTVHVMTIPGTRATLEGRILPTHLVKDRDICHFQDHLDVQVVVDKGNQEVGQDLEVGQDHVVGQDQEVGEDQVGVDVGRDQMGRRPHRRPHQLQVPKAQAERLERYETACSRTIMVSC